MKVSRVCTLRNDVQRRAPCEEQQDVRSRDTCHAGAGFVRGGADVRDDDDVLHRQESRIHARLVFVNVERGAAQVTAVECVAERVFIDDRPPRGVHDVRAALHLSESRGIDQVKLFVDIVKKNGLEKAESLKKTPVIIQSFDEAAIGRVSIDLPTMPRVFLTSNDEDVAEPRLRALAKFATGIAPEKFVIARHPEMVARAHAAGLTATSWTFRSDEKTEYPNVGAEMSHFLYDLGIDALFTNNPDLFPRRAIKN